MKTLNTEEARRWRLVLGEESATSLEVELSLEESRMDEALGALYQAGEHPKSQRGGLGASAPQVARWLGDIRRFFPSSVVSILQRDAMDRLDLKQLLLEPEMLSAAEPDVHLAATLISLNRAMPEKTRETARLVVGRIVDEILRRLAEPMRQAVGGALARNVRNNRPRLREIDWARTIQANLRHYQPAQRTIIPEKLIGYGRKRASLRDVILCVDQSGSMATSVVYSSIFGAVLASLPAVSTRMVVFDTAVVDLTADLRDPVDLLFGAQLGGGTDIHRALVYCEGLMTRPADTVLVLVSDLFEGGNQAQMIKTVARLVLAGVRMIALLALSDDGRPSYDARNAAAYAALGVPVFACTPDHFPALMAAALAKRELGQWAAQHGIKLASADKSLTTP
ncbi:VWA domain-containing protein [Rariglobus hedericola]|uniref:VWA domain-containing protein n=1 Tax=Rariglobus hedericola TaxID=2597822 RepID=A0A556QR11_9BACT|nr:VWA domain-containing protein [Rariglobus hedericola]TSJ79077.1 VWA domain-containing protein [Rariglobus hedericola]